MRRAPEVVLVHGMWHRPEHFATFRAALEEAGYAVGVPALHRGSLAADVAAVQAAVDASLEGCGEPPMLVAHSYGGAVGGHVTGVRAMLLVTAFVLEVGESCASVAGEPPCRPAIVSNPDGSTSLDPALAAEYFYADCPPEAVERAVALLVPQARGTGRAVASASTWREVPTRYVVCENDRAIEPAVQRRLAARCSTSVSMATSHSPFISAPEALVEQVAMLG